MNPSIYFVFICYKITTSSLQFYKFIHAVSANAEKSIFQVGVLLDRYFLSFCGGRTPQGLRVLFHYTRHTFRARDSQISANFALQQIARDNREPYPATGNAFPENFYMDYSMGSLAGSRNAIQLSSKLVNLNFLQEGFNRTNSSATPQDWQLEGITMLAKSIH